MPHRICHCPEGAIVYITSWQEGVLEAIRWLDAKHSTNCIHEHGENKPGPSFFPFPWTE